jgi:hypothetical protein
MHPVNGGGFRTYSKKMSSHEEFRYLALTSNESAKVYFLVSYQTTMMMMMIKLKMMMMMNTAILPSVTKTTGLQFDHGRFSKANFPQFITNTCYILVK